MVKILHKYLLKEFIASFGFGLIIFSAILLLDQIFQFVDLFLSKGVSFFLILQLFVLIIPNILSLTIPMAILFGALLSYGRFAEDNEITVMKATGISYKTMSMPLIVFVICISIGLVWFNHYLSPSTHQYFRTLYKKILTEAPLAKFSEKTITSIGDYKIYAHEVNSKDNTLNGINIYKFEKLENKDTNRKTDHIPWRIAASHGKIGVDKNTVVLTLYDGYWQRTDPNEYGSMIHMNFGTYKFVIPISSQIDLSDTALRELNSKQLREKIKTAANDFERNSLTNEYWLRWTVAVAPIVFVLIAIPVGIMAGKGGKAIGFGMSLGVIFTYYLFLVISLNVGEKGYVPSWCVMWLPDFVLLIVGILLFRKMLKK
ncbi:MAG: LptF/LptG family permease [Elusimicrobia bacterium]|nr:LptF/LptG family permease [Elusimicrobiota bacterium]